MNKIENIGIIGIGSYVPEKILTNEDIDLLGGDTDAEWTKQKLGITERRVVENELPSDLAYHASIAAIKDANINKEDIDLIIGGHTHTFLDKPTVETNAVGKSVLVNQVGCYGLYLGKIDFYFDGNSKILQEKKYFPYWYNRLRRESRS